MSDKHVKTSWSCYFRKSLVICEYQLLFVCEGQHRFLVYDCRLMGHPAQPKAIIFRKPLELIWSESKHWKTHVVMLFQQVTTSSWIQIICCMRGATPISEQRVKTNGTPDTTKISNIQKTTGIRYVFDKHVKNKLFMLFQKVTNNIWISIICCMRGPTPISE